MDINQIIEQEGNRKDFEYKGYKCHILRAELKHLCGYVELPPHHKFYKVDEYHLDNLEVHGGITWADNFLPDLDSCKIDNWVIGFDCAHHGDWVRYSESKNDIYRTMEYVENEIKKLVVQIDN